MSTLLMKWDPVDWSTEGIHPALYRIGNREISEIKKHYGFEGPGSELNHSSFIGQCEQPGPVALFSYVTSRPAALVIAWPENGAVEVLTHTCDQMCRDGRFSSSRDELNLQWALGEMGLTVPSYWHVGEGATEKGWKPNPGRLFYPNDSALMYRMLGLPHPTLLPDEAFLEWHEALDSE